jgi:type IV pilus assembly protein PilE
VREGNAERGFTLIELMVVVAIVAILAAVVIPQFMSGATKSKRLTEINAFFAELTVKQDQFKLESSKYMGLATDTNYVGTTTCPATLPSADYNFSTTCVTSGSAWEKLRVEPPSLSSSTGSTGFMVRCQYTITAGLGGTTWTVPTSFKNSQGATGDEKTPAGPWWYVHAKCDEIAGGTYAEYYTSSVDHRIQKKNEGN